MSDLHSTRNSFPELEDLLSVQAYRYEQPRLLITLRPTLTLGTLQCMSIVTLAEFNPRTSETVPLKKFVWKDKGSLTESNLSRRVTGEDKYLAKTGRNLVGFQRRSAF